MTKKEIAELVVSNYERVIKEGKKDNHECFIKRLDKNKMSGGICSFLYYILKRKDERTRLRNLINKHAKYTLDGIYVGNGSYWARIPAYSNSKKEAVELMRKRINILKAEFKGL